MEKLLCTLIEKLVPGIVAGMGFSASGFCIIKILLRILGKA